MSAVSTKTICGRCFSGYIENGVCTSCHAKGEENRNASALPRGARLYGGRYVVGDVLGSGGFGITYAARDVQLSERVAIKELFPDRGFSRTQDKLTVRPDPDQEEYFKHISRRFTEEASMLAKLVGQPNIVSVYNTFSENNTVYYVMEFLEGSDLQHVVVKNGRLSYRRARDSAQQKHGPPRYKARKYFYYPRRQPEAYRLRLGKNLQPGQKLLKIRDRGVCPV